MMLTTCSDLRELYNQIQHLEATSVIHFNFWVTVILSVIFCFFIADLIVRIRYGSVY